MHTHGTVHVQLNFMEFMEYYETLHVNSQGMVHVQLNFMPAYETLLVQCMHLERFMYNSILHAFKVFLVHVHESTHVQV